MYIYSQEIKKSLIIDRTTRWKIRKNMEKLKKIISQDDPIAICGTVSPTRAGYTFFF